MLAHEAVRLTAEEELKAAEAWAKRYGGVQMEWIPSSLELRVSFKQKESNEEFFLRGSLQDYRAQPPAWEFCDSEWNPGGEAFFPRPVSVCGNSMFIRHNNHAVICAPFNRLAYGAYGGPHSDWGSAASWLQAGRGHVQAFNLAEMLSCIMRDFAPTTGRMK